MYPVCPSKNTLISLSRTNRLLAQQYVRFSPHSPFMFSNLPLVHANSKSQAEFLLSPRYASLCRSTVVLHLATKPNHQKPHTHITTSAPQIWPMDSKAVTLE